MKTKYIFQIITVLFFSFMLVFCTRDKHDGEKDPNIVRAYSNKNYYASAKMDSIEAIYHITAQKLQEVYDLAILAAENKSNKDIDTLLFSQLAGYFPKGDTIYVSKIVNELDSLKVKDVDVKIEKNNKIDSAILNDSIGKVYFKTTYFYDKKKKNSASYYKLVSYILKKNPEKFKAEFKFYFSSIENVKSPQK